MSDHISDKHQTTPNHDSKPQSAEQGGNEVQDKTSKPYAHVQERITPPMIAQFQRSIGNRATQNLMKQSKSIPSTSKSSTDKQHIQRSAGFEAELSIPSLGPAPSNVSQTRLKDHQGKATVAIEQFIFGGLPYGEDRGSNAFFTLKPDHNELQKKAREIWKKLETLGLLLEMPADSTSNLEYVTLAIDELAPKSTKAYTDQFDAIKNHADFVVGDAKNKIVQLGSPANDTYTGIPVDDFKSWLGDDYNEIEDLVIDFQNAVKNEFYIQATVGIIPSAIRDLHQKHTRDDIKGLVTPREAAIFFANQITDNAEKLFLAARKSDKYPFFHNMKDVDFQSFMGIVHILAMYKIGSAINQTSAIPKSSSSKNAVPFMSKMKSMGDILKKAGTTYLQNTNVPNWVMKKIDDRIDKSDAIKPDFWLKNFSKLEDYRGVRPSIFLGDSVEDIELEEMGFVTTVMSGLKPNVMNTGKDRTFEEPDAMPDAVSQASEGQKGAQFEYRWLSDYPDSSGLAAALMKVVNEVRELNLKHVDGNEKQTILTKVDE